MVSTIIAMVCFYSRAYVLCVSIILVETCYSFSVPASLSPPAVLAALESDETNYSE